VHALDRDRHFTGPIVQHFPIEQNELTNDFAALSNGKPVCSASAIDLGLAHKREAVLRRLTSSTYTLHLFFSLARLVFY
jgi:hypothetical protein